jgi:hypothetical protein
VKCNNIIGVVLDLESEDSKKIVIDSLVDILNNSDQNLFYLCNNTILSLPSDVGESLLQTITYQNPKSFDLDKLFKDAVVKIGNFNGSFYKYIFLFTDRFDGRSSGNYKKSLLANKIRGYESKICIFGFGSTYDKNLLSLVAKTNEVYFEDLSDCESLILKLQEILKESDNGKS